MGKFADLFQNADAGDIAGAGGIMGGLGNIVGGIIGSKARREEQQQARTAHRARLNQFKLADYYGTVMANPWEDITVNQLQAKFQARQQQQGLGTTMATLRDAAGGSGIASLAQTIANQQAQNLSQISGQIGQQEARNQELMGRGEYMRSLAVERAETRVRDKNETLLALAAQRKEIADQARKDATAALTSGIGQVAGGVLKAMNPV